MKKTPQKNNEKKKMKENVLRNKLKRSYISEGGSGVMNQKEE